MQRNNITKFAKRILRGIKKSFLCSKIKTSDYYNSIDVLPILNWFKIQKTNDLRYLYKEFNSKKCVPNKFYQIYEIMQFDFEKLELDDLRNVNKEAYYRAMYYETSDKKWLNRANELKNQLNERAKKSERSQTVGDFLNYIELAINDIGKLDAMKLSTRRAFELYYIAKEIYTQRSKQVKHK